MIPVILAGGVGSRLWPLSRALYPKQFLALTEGSQSLLQLTAERVRGLPGDEPPLVVCNEEHRFMVAEQLREQDTPARRILLEPVARNTAPAIALAALELAAETGGDPVMVVLPADHFIHDAAGFRKTLACAAEVAQQGRLVTLGVRPTKPDVGYGYIRANQAPDDGQAVEVQEFIEKPALEAAERFVASGRFFWNSGIFVLRVSALLEELEQHAPAILNACREAMGTREQDGVFARIDSAAFAKAPGESLDYAVMEHTQRASMLTLTSDWSDVGGWSALWELNDGHDEQGNVVRGDTLLQDVSGSYVRSESRLVSALGVRDMVIVETADAVLVAPKERVQEVKQCVERLQDGAREEARLHKRVYRPWGWYESLVHDTGFQVKRLMVKPGGKLSLQMHHQRAEHWTVVCGTAYVTIGEREFELEHDQSTYIPMGTRHRLENRSEASLEVVEVQTGDYLGEDDIVRFDDHYGRIVG